MTDKLTLDPEQLSHRYLTDEEVAELEERAAVRVGERADYKQKREEDREDTKFILTAAAFAGMAVLASVGIANYNKAHPVRPAGPATPIERSYIPSQP